MQVHDPEQIREYEAANAWGDETLLDTFAEAVADHPDRTAVVDPPNTPDLVGRDPEELTYAELSAAVDATATWLREQGIGKDDFVVVQAPNTWELAMLYLAIARAGAVASPMPIQWRRRELEHVAETTEAVAYVCIESFSDFDHRAMGEEVAAESDTLDRVLTLDAVREAAQSGECDTAALDAVEVGANEVFNVQWTSGTTAEPKACPMTHNNWQTNPTPTLCRMDDGGVILCAAPLVNMTALGVNYVPWLLTRATLVLHHPIDLGLMVRQMQEESVTFTILVPAMLNALLKHPDVDDFDLGHVETITTGSAAPSEWSLREFEDRWDIEIINIWGQNEGTATISGPLTTPLERRSTDFPRLRRDVDWGIDDPGVEAVDTKLVDDDGNEVSEVGEVGELAFRGPGLMAGYYNQPDLTEAAFDEDGYFYTGDLFRIEPDDFMSFFDRKKDVIIRGGFTISAKEIENLAIEHEAVADAAAIGMPDPDLGERVCLYVVPAEGASVTLSDITDHMGEETAVYKRPERLEVVEEIPRNPVGKVLKTDLRADIEGKVGEDGSSPGSSG